MSQADFDLLATVASSAQKQQHALSAQSAASGCDIDVDVTRRHSDQQADIIPVLRDCPFGPDATVARVPCAWLEGSCGNGSAAVEGTTTAAGDMPELPSLDALSDERLSLNDAFYHRHPKAAASQAVCAASIMAATDSAAASLPAEMDVDMCAAASVSGASTSTCAFTRSINPLHSMQSAGTWRFMCRDSNGRRGGVKAIRIWGRMGHVSADAVALHSIRTAADSDRAGDATSIDEDERSFCVTIKFYSCRSFQNRNAHYQRGRAAHVLLGADGRCGFTLREVSSRNGMVSMNQDGLDLATRPIPPIGATAAIDQATLNSSRPAFALSIDTQYEWHSSRLLPIARRDASASFIIRTYA